MEIRICTKKICLGSGLLPNTLNALCKSVGMRKSSLVFCIPTNICNVMGSNHTLHCKGHFYAHSQTLEAGIVPIIALRELHTLIIHVWVILISIVIPIMVSIVTPIMVSIGIPNVISMVIQFVVSQIWLWLKSLYVFLDTLLWTY